MYNLKTNIINNTGLFRDTSAYILNENLEKIDNINLDIQAFDRNISNEAGFHIETNYKIYCDINHNININGYFYTEDKILFKILKIASFPEFIVAWCYKCKNISVKGENNV